jgi:group I intron endonuclease
MSASGAGGIIYVTTCLVNGKQYVGLHTRGQAGYLGSGHVLANAIKKYGRENFERKTIDEFGSIEEGCAKERYWISEMNTKAPHGYNLNGGGEGQFNPCEETRAKISANNGSRSPEARAKLSAAGMGNKNLLGYRHSDEARAKISANSGSHRPEVRAKVSAARVAYWAKRKAIEATP